MKAPPKPTRFEGEDCRGQSDRGRGESERVCESEIGKRYGNNKQKRPSEATLPMADPQIIPEMDKRGMYSLFSEFDVLYSKNRSKS